MLLQGIQARRCSLRQRCPQRLPVQIPVRRILNARRYQDLHRVRVHSEEQRVEERVEIGA